MKGGHIEEKGERRNRKVSLPAQRYQPEQFESAKEPQKKGTLWQNVKRKISVSLSTEEPLKTEEHAEWTGKCATALKAECTRGNLEVTESPRLRRVNSDVGEEDVMHFAIVEGDLKLLKSIIDGSRVNVNHLRPPGTAPLHQACISGNLDIVDLLAKNGANIQLRDHRDLSPLQIANLYGHFEIAEYLIRIGSPIVDIKDGFQIEKRKRKRSWCFRLGVRQSAYQPVNKENDS